MLMMKEDGMQIGRFKVRRLMRELNLISKQPGSHAYKKATVERPDIPNVLDRGFSVASPNTVWCGDITYVWAEGQWHYLAAVIDLCARRVVGWAFSAKPDADLVIKALDMAYGTRSINPTYPKVGQRSTVASAVSSSTATELRSPLPTKHGATAPVCGAATYRAPGR